MKPAEISFTPVDNHRLANLCGALDENLRQIQTALDVGITRRGEHFAVTGTPDRTRIATRVLRDFYDKAADPLSLPAPGECLAGAVNIRHIVPRGLASGGARSAKEAEASLGGDWEDEEEVPPLG